MFRVEIFSFSLFLLKEKKRKKERDEKCVLLSSVETVGVKRKEMHGEVESIRSVRLKTSCQENPSTNSWFERKIFRQLKKIFQRRTTNLIHFSVKIEVSSNEQIEEKNEISPVEKSEKIEEKVELDFLYDYDRLLSRCLEKSEENREELVRRSQTAISIPRSDFSHRTSFSVLLNWKSYRRLLKNLSRSEKHFRIFVEQTFRCETKVNRRQQLLLPLRVKRMEFDRLLQNFLEQYVTCPQCRTAQTRLIKQNNDWKVECQICGVQTTVQRLKSNKKHFQTPI